MRYPTILFAALLASSIAAHAAGNPLPVLDATRTAEIAKWLPATPICFTPPFADRAWWDAIARANPAADADLYAEADKQARLPTPKLDEALFNIFKETGDRKAYEAPYMTRTKRLGQFLFAEGLRNDGKLLPAIEREIAAMLDEPTWAIPSHASRRADWHAAYDLVELGAVNRAANLALAHYLLGQKISSSTRVKIRKEIHARVFAPDLERIRSSNTLGPEYWWMKTNNNWNAVCHGSILMTALLLGPTDIGDDRATFAAAFEAFTPVFIAGFGDDGFCHEGIGYWYYGYGNYILASELTRLATSGHVDLLDAPKQQRIATFDTRWQIAAGIYPPFGDAAVDARAPAWMHDFATIRYKLPYGIRGPGVGLGMIHHIGIGPNLCITPFDLSLSRPDGPPPPAPGLRDWFPDGGALVVRRATPVTGLAAAFKGGHNNQPHNHNDLGSFVIVCDGESVLSDLGVDAYVKDTFSSKRYTSSVMNSFGHPVPLVAGKLQRTGADAHAETVRTGFTDACDLWEIDITSAYAPDVPSLEKLTRTFIYTRSTSDAPQGRVEIIDRVKFRDGQPQPFGTALVFRPKQTWSALTAAEPSGREGLRVRAPSGSTSLDVSWQAQADGHDISLTQNESPVIGIAPAQGSKGTRLGLDLPAPVTQATLHLTILPAR
ncbi:heparinase II/III family protein [Geminisphaera colitermitum]|uniref:heparinase II/III family protein n=1 Tax=Geminisphaera colitermitum TaxID=1148786 RepID=UPI000158C855|nr:heparinase II/III family protein [Geminisphaera colitermitum]